MSEHEQGAINLLRNPAFLDASVPVDPMGRAQALALLAINDQLKMIARSLQAISKEDLVALAGTEITEDSANGKTVSAEGAFATYERCRGK